MSDKKTKIFIISGLSGAGKDSVVGGLKKELKFIRLITTTTRPKRKGEKEGKPYHFITREKFKKLIKAGQFLEWSEVYGYYYGSTREEAKKALRKKLPVILVVDYQGARKIKKKIPEAKVIFLTVESSKSLKNRLAKRDQDSSATIMKRLKEARAELKTLKKWNYVVVNKENKLKETIKKVRSIILRNL